MRSVEFAPTAWRRSGHSNGAGAECVEVAVASGVAGVRDSKDRGGSVLVFGGDALTRFLTAATQGHFDLR